MKVAITGASGFIGKYVLTELYRHVDSITAVTRRSENLFFTKGKVSIVEMNLSDPGNNCFDTLGSPDILIHLAWDGLPNYQSLHHFENELPLQYKFLLKMIKGGLKSLFCLGTCFEYGMASGGLSPNILTAPSNPYGFAKDVLRKQLEFTQKSIPFNLTWARLFYIYGDGQSENSLYSQIKKAVINGETVFNMSKGDQIRDFLHVSTVAQSIVNYALFKCASGLINICSGEPISVKSLVEKWIAENNWNIKLNLGYFPYSEFEPMNFWGIKSQ
jgi:dTDP-6-deoxy-L-talose 4-dehydrogenase (NAD+)